MTKLKYLQDSSLTVSEATCLEVEEEQGAVAVILDETIFYPQGGGQPCDTGKIYNDHAEFLVTNVRLDENGVVHHFGSFGSGRFAVDEKVKLEIDSEKRALHTKLHSAGHLIDCAVEKMGLDNLKPGKGFHFPAGPNVEYEGVVENGAELLPKLQRELQRVVDELIARDIPVEIRDLTLAEAQRQGLFVPAGKTARVINFQDFKPGGCGGTHVKSSGEIGKIIIKKIKSKKGITKISYLVI